MGVPNMQKKEQASVSGERGIRTITYGAVVAFNAHFKKHKGKRITGCRVCQSGLGGLVTITQDPASVEVQDHGVDEGGGADQEGTAASSRSDDRSEEAGDGSKDNEGLLARGDW